MEPKDYTLVSIEGEYAYLREVGETDPEKKNITGLGIGEYLAADKVGISILHAAGQGQKEYGDRCF